MTWNSGWRQRQQNAVDKRMARAERDADPAWQAMQAERLAHRLSVEQAAQEEREREQAQRDAPVREVVEMLRDRFGSDLPAFAAAIKRVGGLAKVADFLSRTLVQHEKAEREAADRETTVALTARARVERAATTEQRQARLKAVEEAKRAVLAMQEPA